MSQRARVHYKTFVFDSARWDGFEFRPGDIVISTPPKCGTTWLQRICALLIFQTPELAKPLTTLSPWLDMLTRPHAENLAELAAQTHRRFIKSHTPLDGLPFDERVFYLGIGRDPRDVALSWDHHVANADVGALLAAREHAVGNADLGSLPAGVLAPPSPTQRERFWAWIDLDTPATETPSSLRVTLHHLASFWDARERPNVVLLHYEELRRDLAGQMRALAARLGIAVPEARWPALIEAAGFEAMRESADRLAPDVTESLWRDNRQFFRSGSSGQWRALFEPGDDERYAARLRALDFAPELVAWAHRGSAPA